MICPEQHSEEQNLTLLRGQALPPTQLGQPTGPRVQELEVGRGTPVPSGCFASFPVTVPQRGSLTRVGRHIPQAGAHGAGHSHSCAKPAGPRASVVFSQRGPSEGSWSGKWAGRLISGTPVLLGVLRRSPEGLLVAPREAVRMEFRFLPQVQAGLGPCRHPSA